MPQAMLAPELEKRNQGAYELQLASAGCWECLATGPRLDRLGTSKGSVSDPFWASKEPKTESRFLSLEISTWNGEFNDVPWPREEPSHSSPWDIYLRIGLRCGPRLRHMEEWRIRTKPNAKTLTWTYDHDHSCQSDTHPVEYPIDIFDTYHDASLVGGASSRWHSSRGRARAQVDGEPHIFSRGSE